MEGIIEHQLGNFKAYFMFGLIKKIFLIIPNKFQELNLLTRIMFDKCSHCAITFAPVSLLIGVVSRFHFVKSSLQPGTVDFNSP